MIKLELSKALDWFLYQARDHNVVRIYFFSNSLIIPEEKTKEVTTVKEIWICDPNYHEILVNFSFDFLQELSMLWEAISNTRKSVSSDIQTLWSWLKKTLLHLVFSTHFSVFGYLMKHSSSCLIYYIIWQQRGPSRSDLSESSAISLVVHQGSFIGPLVFILLKW